MHQRTIGRKLWFFQKIRVLIIIVLLSILHGIPTAEAACIDIPTGAVQLTGGTYTGYQIFRIDANDGDSVRVHVSENADEIYMILYSPMSSTQVCERLRGTNIEGAGTKTLEFDFPYDDTWYLNVYGFGTVNEYNLQVTISAGTDGEVDCDKYCEESG